MTEFDEADWRERLRESRAEKDEFLSTDRRSPLSPAVREEFDGLEYFEPAPAYRVEATVRIDDDAEPVEATVENGDPQRLVPVVTFEFELPTAGGDDTVAESVCGYRPTGGGDGIFVPFRDKTTGQATYRGGRYLDFHPESELTDGDEVVVDFNLAYTPFCAFDDAFACPLPPEENWLSTTVPAGERAPDLEAATTES
ncbi:DUF1684 domain-containing protein [Halobaculum sp. MBLA0143]|uniref:DUF1684 domain-containing protein n=1 Tax=Halobaculum sp. MBLA0143 TaxID=3079933 RepID=UPI0035243DD0